MSLGSDKKQGSNKTSKNEVVQGLVGLAVIVVLAIIFVPMFFGRDKDDSQDKKDDAAVQQIKESDEALVKKTTEELDNLGESLKKTIASEPNGGRQGTIVKTEAGMSGNSVNVTVSTHFDNPSEEGKQIAKNIFVSICASVPNLDSLYVTSEPTGVESSSVYRKDIPACSN